MDKTIQKHIVTYFNTFDAHVKKWNDIIEKIQRPLTGLKNQSEQLIHVEKTRIDEDLSQFPELKEKLLFKILCGIDSEMLLIKNAINEMNSINQDLRNKLVSFEKSTSDFDWYYEDAQTGNAFQPKLSDLLQIGYEAWKYYNDSYQSISSAYKTLDVRNNESINKLEKSLVINEDIQLRINYILAITQYCNRNL